MSQGTNGIRPPLPESMDETVPGIIATGWPVDPAARRTFDEIFDAMPRIRFKMTLVVDVRKATEFATLADSSAVARTAKQSPALVRKGKLGLDDGQEKAIFSISPTGSLRTSQGNAAGTCTTSTSPAPHHRNHTTTGTRLLKGRPRRKLLIWKCIHFSCQLITRRNRVFCTRETIGCAWVRGGL
jgi:hypothetical protein